MKGQNFRIKVSDLLKKVGKTDRIVFEEIFIDEITGLDEKGIQGTIVLQSINQDAILATLEDITCCINEYCDNCTVPYMREVYIEEYDAKFIDPEYYKDDEQDENQDLIFPIDHRSETIDIKNMLIQAVGLEKPLVSRCDACTVKNKDNNYEIDDFETENHFESGGNIVFH